MSNPTTPTKKTWKAENIYGPLLGLVLIAFTLLLLYWLVCFGRFIYFHGWEELTTLWKASGPTHR